MSEKLKHTFRERGDSYLRDAENTALAMDSRATLAFDAAYMYALSTQDSEALELEHPHPDVLLAAAAALGWHVREFDIALRHLTDRRATLRDSTQLERLLELALRLKMATA